MNIPTLAELEIERKKVNDLTYTASGNEFLHHKEVLTQIDAQIFILKQVEPLLKELTEKYQSLEKAFIQQGENGIKLRKQNEKMLLFIQDVATSEYLDNEVPTTVENAKELLTDLEKKP